MSTRSLQPDDVRARLDCRVLAEALGVRFRRRTGAWWLAHCFLPDAHSHGDRNPSLTVGLEGFRCHGCGASGDAFAMLQTMGHASDFKSALGMLASWVGLETSPDAPRRALLHRTIPTSPAKPPARSTSLSDPALDLTLKVWARIGDLQPTPSAQRWLQGRALSETTAWDAGCRDVGPVRSDLLDLIARNPTGAQDLGFTREGKIWWPLRASEDLAGLAFPCWLPNEPAPRRWRWRFYQPPTIRGTQIKCASCYGDTAPMGLQLADTLWLTDAASAPVVVLVEGEPDWLAVLHELGPDFGVVSLPNIKAYTSLERAPFGWLQDLRACRVLVVATHCDRSCPDGQHAPGCTAREVLASTHEALKHLDQPPALYIQAVDETRDANDLAQQGELSAWAKALRTLHPNHSGE